MAQGELTDVVYVNPRLPKSRKCKNCSEEFCPKQVRNIFCSSECCKEWYSSNNGFLKLRMDILDRDGFRCQYCGRSPMNTPDVILEIDHKTPKEQGGNDEKDNLITSCKECNGGKSCILLKYWKDNKAVRRTKRRQVDTCIA